MSATRQAGIEALFVTDLVNTRWLSGFSGSNGWLLVTADDVTLFTDGRYGDQARHQLSAAGIEAEVSVGTTRAKMVGALAAAVSSRSISRLGFEADNLTVADHAGFTAAVGTEWVATTGVVEPLRRCKDQGEIDRVARAAAIADDALGATLGLLSSEPTEASFRDALEAAMRAGGADGPSFDTIIAAGANAALPHHHPDHTRIVEGMTVVVDFGALYDGYHSDMTRTFCIGDPTPMQA
ncbi:MAG TPA: M24 family metallopeptidase, partial [Ilumatobacteraceae bacterium]|nr:M24 family metallopeptidase [Ilumatobacteraceae bacterium]